MEAEDYTPKLVNGGEPRDTNESVYPTKLVASQESKFQSNPSNFDSTQSSQNQYYTPNNQSSFSNPPPVQTGNYLPRAPQQFNNQPYSQQFQPRAPQQGPVLRRTDSRSYIPPQQQGSPGPGPPQQRLPLNFQPQNWNRPLRPPIRPDQQYRPQAPNSEQYRPQQVNQNGDQYRPPDGSTYRPPDPNRNSLNSNEQFRPSQDQNRQGDYSTIDRRPSDSYNPSQSGQYYQQNQPQQLTPNQQYPPGQRPPFIRKPSPWALVKEKLPPQIHGNRFPFPLRTPTPPDNMSQNRSPSADQRPQQSPGSQAPTANNAQTPTTPQPTTPSSQMERTTLNFSMNDMPPRQIPPNVRPIRPLMRMDSRMMSPNDPNFRMPMRPGMMPNENRGRDSPGGQPLPPGMRMPNYPENPNYQRQGMNSSQPSSTTSSTPKSHRSSIDEDEDVSGRRDLPSRPPSAGGNSIDPRILQEKRPPNQKVFDPNFKMDDLQNGRNMLRPEMVRMNTPPLSELQRDAMPPYENARRFGDSPVTNKPNRPTELKFQDVPNNLAQSPSTPMTPSGDLRRHSSMRQSKRNFGKDGDNDSGVDENTQSKDSRSAGHLRSPLKSPSSRLPSRKLTPTRSPMTPKSPDGSTTSERKKLPMNKIQVGAAPSPNLKKVTSKIGSLQNAHYKPGGGKVKIENRKLEWKAEPRIAAKNDEYVPGGGDKKIEVVKLNWNAKPKVGSLDNATHKPGGGDKKIESVKLDFKDKAKPKVGSKDNLKHSPGGGTVKIEEQKLDIKAQSKIGSLDNVKHKPGGGEKKIFDDKDYLKQKAAGDSKPTSEVPSENQSPAHSLSLSSAHSPSPTMHQDS
ncbi:pollen-specific leucine-rich repeat extensin-like protein 1 isoform X3 [Diaphorina citri]|uniref:Microtubule-associated protein n=1 Tax=Diaphorina citri TaxID=121845 RepID=A0A3Q0IV45_DIACI|nr:pollen-specific leucine-rich repeat extensin-like protein 1 isoform X3 [Diaphorina citri]